MFWISLAVLVGVWVFGFWLRFRGPYQLPFWGYGRTINFRWVFVAVIAVVAINLFYLTRSQFFLWYNDEFSKYLIPPYSGIGYFIFYTFTRFWAPYVISLAVALIFLWLAGYFNKRKDYRFFQPEEPYFLAIAIFLSGHPAWVLYLILALSGGLAFTLLARGSWLRGSYRKMFALNGHATKPLDDRDIANPNSTRISFYHLWLPAGIATVLLNQWFLRSWEAYSQLLL